MILIVDYGGQYVHRIWRTLRELGEDSKIVKPEDAVSEMEALTPKGIILSGGPRSVYDSQEGLGDYKALLKSGLPVLGICFGHQLIAQAYGGRVRLGDSGEYAEVEVMVLDEDCLFRGLPKVLTVWESHRDEVEELPSGFKVLARSDICAIESFCALDKPVFGVQFHPEVHHTPEGKSILRNFLSACGGKK
ncbi:GMP synthase [glutamine-hydrolyzing] subunit A [uncultured archaeon]|nr:GMP synthase [glutamine-hydrolyzing] subunit A [uncultured archaeon]